MSKEKKVHIVMTQHLPNHFVGQGARYSQEEALNIARDWNQGNPGTPAWIEQAGKPTRQTSKK